MQETTSTEVPQDNKHQIAELRQEYIKKNYLLRINLFRDDIEGSFTPPPFYFKLTRFCYLWTFLSEIKDFFDYYAQTTTRHENWFEHKGSPIPWDIPFGAILDLYLESEHDKYFDIVFHYRNYPLKELGALKNIDYIKECIIHNLKESAWIRSGKSDCIKNKLNPSDIDYFWKYVQEQKTKDIQTILDKLRPVFVTEQVPVKCFLKNTNQMLNKSVNREWTCLDFVKRHFPIILDEDEKLKDEYSKFKLLISGVEIPLTTSFNVIDYVMSYMDFYIYITVTY